MSLEETYITMSEQERIAGTNDEEDVQAVLDHLNSEKPIFLSQILVLRKRISTALYEGIMNHGAEWSALANKKARENYWLNDSNANVRVFVDRYYAGSSSSDPNRQSTPRQIPRLASKHSVRDDASSSDEVEVVKPVPKIKLNELVRTPPTFDGEKLHPRTWMDDFERAAEANHWPDEAKVTYMPTFLEKSALDWHSTILKRNVGTNPSWVETKGAFLRHYSGKTDVPSLRRQIDRTFQMREEKAINFIPRIMRLLELENPDRAEDELVEKIQGKLRQDYQDKLVLIDITFIE